MLRFDAIRSSYLVAPEDRMMDLVALSRVVCLRVLKLPMHLEPSNFQGQLSIIIVKQ